MSFLLAFAALSILAVLLLRLPREENPIHPLSEGAGATSKAHESTQYESGTIPPSFSSPPAAAIDGTQREPIPTGSVYVTGRVLARDGSPIAGAVVTWTAWSPLDLAWEPAWQADDWGPLHRATREARTDELGRFHFGEGLDAPLGAVLWASHAGYTASCRLHGPESSGFEGLTLGLEPAAPAGARVIDAAARAVPGAVVEQFGLTPRSAPFGADGRTEERARRLFARRYTADESGRVELAGFPGESVLMASQNTKTSEPWRGLPGIEVTLRLTGAFTIGGTVELPDWSHLNYTGERRIVLTAELGTESRVLASLRPIEEGEWGPCALPILVGARYALKLEGSPVIPVFRDFTAGAPGAHLELHLRAELGNALSLYVEDEHAVPIPDAEVASYWEQDGEQRVLRRRAAADGYIDNWSFPDGARVRSFISAPGFAGQWLGEIQFPEPSRRTHRVTLERSANLVGQCLLEGKPLEDFEVLAWRPGRCAFSQIAQSFRGREDGTFELADVPSGELAVCASTLLLPFTRPVHVVVPSERELLLELAAPILGSGEVVDLESGRPIPKATVHVLAPLAEGQLRPWGRRREVDQDGGFSIQGFLPGENAVRVRAEGYVVRDRRASSRDGRVDFGRITLDRLRALDLRLLADSPHDFTAITAAGIGSTAWRRRSFDGEGRLRFDEASAGIHFVALEGTPQATTVVLRLDLRPGRAWSYTHKIAGTRRLSMEIVGETDESTSSLLGLSISYPSPEGAHTELALPFQSQGIVTVDGIDADSAQVSVMGPLRTQTGALATLRGEELYARLDLGGVPFLLRVVDPSGAPVSGALVRLADSQPSAFYSVASADQDGVCLLRGLPERTLIVSVEHETRGRITGVPIDGGAGEAEVVLASDAALELVIRDGTEPLAGVDVNVLITSIGPRWTLLGMSDSEGRVSAGQLAEASYRVATEHPDCWPTTVEARAARDPLPAEVQVRRRGSLSFEVRNASGSPMVGGLIELVSEEFDAMVEAWLEEGLVSGSLACDPAGRARVERLPRGRYSWRVLASDGERLSGTCEVLPGRLVHVPVSLP
jgi:hypothetical protein